MSPEEIQRRFRALPSAPVSVATPVLAGACRQALVAAAQEAFRTAALAELLDDTEAGRVVVTWVPERVS
ncbi:MAG: hypothetical protein ABW167_00420 [Baekduia sp.]